MEAVRKLVDFERLHPIMNQKTLGGAWLYPSISNSLTFLTL